MSEAHIVRNCAPTLAGLKTGNIFQYPYERKEELIRFIRQLNRRLANKGIRVVPMRITEKRALLYLFRPKQLGADLSHSDAAGILRSRGYCPERCGQCVQRLGKKLRQQEDFPHEIGLFLGYPPEDVEGFIDNNAQDCKCTGCWKVYGDEEAAKKTFAQYKKCTKIYCDCWEKGTTLERLAVSRRR